MKKDDTLQLDAIIQAFLRVKGYEKHDYVCLVSEPGADETAIVTCMDPRTAIDELNACSRALTANLERLTQ